MILVATAVICATADLVHKTHTSAEFHHARAPYLAFLIAALIAALVLFVPRVASTSAAVGAGIACGGAFGNLVSLLAWRQGVPDPLVLAAGAAHGVAFNLADLFAVGGDALLVGAVIVHGVQQRARLREPV
jgi:lipoprotein signal peptidase